MPTLEEWRRALSEPRTIDVESSLQLINAVQAKHSSSDAQLLQAGKTPLHRKQNLTTVAPFTPMTQVQVVPAFLLHRLGVVTTPQVENLADLSAMWAYIRYLWAFDAPTSGTVGNLPLRLSEEARRIDFHQKSVLSDQIGVGIAAVLIQTHFDAPLVADVSVAMNDPAWPIQTINRLSPDYLFFNADHSDLFIVECKGTQSSRSEAISQLRRACEQAASLRFTDGRADPPALVVATFLSATGTKVLVLDPPGDEEKTPSRERDWNVSDSPKFYQGTRNLSEARLLTFAGLDDEARNKSDVAGVQRPERTRRVQREISTVENAAGRFRGTIQRIPTQDRMRLDIFQGLEAQVAASFAVDDPQRSQQVIREFRHRAVQQVAGTDQPVTTEERSNSVIVRSFGPDGSLLEFRLQPD
jgi:hypothetical protein